MAMTALQWGRARSSAETRAAGHEQGHDPSSFNGAALVRPRKRNSGPLVRSPTCIASMGPRSFERGNVGRNLEAVSYKAASMGPRSFERGNEEIGVVEAVSSSGFNGAALVRPRKQARCRIVRGALALGFNGAALVRARKHRVPGWVRRRY